MTTKILKSISVTVLDIVVYSFLIITFLLSVFSFFNKKSIDGTVSFFNYETRLVLTNSMEKSAGTKETSYEIAEIPTNSLILIEKIPKETTKQNEWIKNLKVGDVLTFNYSYFETSVITHRITKISEKETGGYIIELKGDNGSQGNMPLTQVIDTSLDSTPNFIIGKVKGSSLFLGEIVVALKKPVTMLLSIILPCCIIIMYELYRIARVNFAQKLEQKEKQIARLQSELEKINDFIKEREQWNKEDMVTEL